MVAFRTTRTSLYYAALCLLTACSRGDGEANMTDQKQPVVRKALGAGRWFEKNPEKLTAMVDGYIEAASPESDGRIVAALAPHAGYVYSGKVAGYTFRAIRDDAESGKGPETVVIIGFSHNGPFRGVALMNGDAIATPVGETPLDRESTAFLADHSDRIFEDYTPHAGEHSAENEIPFTQRAVPDAKLIVAIIGDHDQATASALTEALAKLAARKRILVVASTDMLHHPDYELVSETDRKTLAKVVAMDRDKVAASWTGDRQVFCGIMPVLVAMEFASLMGCKEATLLHYRNSGDDFPESRGRYVVGYGSVAFTVKD